MIPEFLDYCEQLFPSIDPYTAEGAKNALKQFEESDCLNNLTLASSDGDLRQGDIFSWVPFFVSDNDGKLQLYDLKAMLLTNTCDCVRNDYLEFAAVWRLHDFSPDPKRVRDIKRNCNFQYLYIPDRRIEDDLIDFGLITSLPRTVFERFLTEGRTKKIVSLSWVGYYMFLAKLTVFFMRCEDSDVNASRSID